MADQKPRHVFVVDDEKLIAEILTTILRESGFSAGSFFSPLEALAAAELEAPDLLFSDVMMPRLHGIDLAIKLTSVPRVQGATVLGTGPDCRLIA